MSLDVFRDALDATGRRRLRRQRLRARRRPQARSRGGDRGPRRRRAAGPGAAPDSPPPGNGSRPSRPLLRLPDDDRGERGRGRARLVQGPRAPRRNPYAVLEGALIAALAVGADRVIIGTKRSRSSTRSRASTRAIAEVTDAGWTDDASIELVAGPEEYLVGEETGLLEVIDGRPPFPRVAPPYRRGRRDRRRRSAADRRDGHGSCETGTADAGRQRRDDGARRRDLAEGPTGSASVGTDDRPAPFVVHGQRLSVTHAGVGEFAIGTPLREVIESSAAAPARRRAIIAVLPGVANPLVPADAARHAGDLRGPAGDRHRARRRRRSSCSTTHIDMAAVAAGVSRFLAVESCGQCTPCKQDGRRDQRAPRSRARRPNQLRDLVAIGELRETITNSARGASSPSSTSGSSAASCGSSSPRLAARAARPRGAAGRADPDRADRANRGRRRGPRRAPAAQAARLDLRPGGLGRGAGRPLRPVTARARAAGVTARRVSGRGPRLRARVRPRPRSAP